MNELQVPDMVNLQIPENKWERVLYLNNIVSQLTEITTQFTEYAQQLISELEGNESDENYHVVPEYEKRKTTLVDEERLKRENPALYRECLVIKPNEAAKIIGMDKLWVTCLKYGGEERTIGASKITLEQMKKVMTTEEYKNYTSEVYKQKGLVVVHK